MSSNKQGDCAFREKKKKATVNTEGSSQSWERECELKYHLLSACLLLEWSSESEDYEKWEHFGE